jgi:hypothetical protein
MREGGSDCALTDTLSPNGPARLARRTRLVLARAMSVPVSLWCSTVGLVLDATGAIVILWPFLRLSQADVLMGDAKLFWAPNTVAEARQDPLTWATLRQVRGMKWGAGLLLLGALLQLAGVWLAWMGV